MLNEHVCLLLLSYEHLSAHSPQSLSWKSMFFMFYRTFYKSDPTCMQRSQTLTFTTLLELSQGWVFCACDLVYGSKHLCGPSVNIEWRYRPLIHPHILSRVAIICRSGQNLPAVLLCSRAPSAPVPARLCSSFLLILISCMTKAGASFGSLLKLVPLLRCCPVKSELILRPRGCANRWDRFI